jgi:predicted phosphoadenosine phosphosulfate sulfurtransferase
MPKTYLTEDVLCAARRRIREIYAHFDKVYLSFSGGKDSGVLLNLALGAARELGRLPLDVLLVDLEGQYAHTISYVQRVFATQDIRPWWVCLPIHLRNAVSQIQPHWMCWDPDKRDAWIRPLPEHRGVISDPGFFPFFRKGMEFEEFVPEFGGWFADGSKTACLVAIRSDESLNRYRTIKNTHKDTLDGRMWTTWLSDTVCNAYPIYDWTTEDVWTANGKLGWDYNRIYDLMHLAGLTLHQMRLCQPYGDDQRKGLYLFKLLEPETWTKVVARVEGANYGSRYSKTQSHIMGNLKVVLPPGHTHKSYAKLLLNTMPPNIAAHYRTKIRTFLRWWRKHRNDEPMVRALREANLLPDWTKGIPDACPDKRLESGLLVNGVRCRLPSWRRIVKVLLKNDYWVKGLSFSPTKREMERQLSLIARFSEARDVG